MNIEYFLFLFGVTCTYSPNKEKVRKTASEKILEPIESKSYRRKITTLSGVVVLTGLAGGSPYDLSVFGVTPSGFKVPLLITAIVVVQVFWYFQRYQHLKEDGEIEIDPATSPRDAQNIKISRAQHLPLVRKRTDVYSNYVSFFLTLYSWYFVAIWWFF